MSKNIGIFIHPESGNVGIGTSQPRAQLEVFGSVVPSSNLGYDLGSPNLRWRELYLSGNSINLDGTLISRDATSGGIKFQTPSGAPVDSFARTLTASNTGTGPALKVTQTGANSIAEFYDDGNALAVKIADGGNVGIGTITPLDLFHIDTSLDASIRVRSGVNKKTSLKLFEDNDFGYEFEYDGTPDLLHLWSRKFAGNEGIRMTWNKSGSVGIGTTQPQGTLHVNGSLTVGSINTVYNIPKTRAQIILRDTSSVSFSSAGFQVFVSWGATWIAYSTNPLYSVSITGDYTDVTGRALNYRIAVQNQNTLAVSYFPSTGGWVKYMYTEQNRLDGHGYHGIMSGLTLGASYKCQLEVEPNSSSPYTWSSGYGTISGIAWD